MRGKRRRDRNAADANVIITIKYMLINQYYYVPLYTAQIYLYSHSIFQMGDEADNMATYIMQGEHELK